MNSQLFTFHFILTFHLALFTLHFTLFTFNFHFAHTGHFPLQRNTQYKNMTIPRRTSQKHYPMLKINHYCNSRFTPHRARGFAETILGRRRIIEDILSESAPARKTAERQAVNTVCQGSSADLIKVQNSWILMIGSRLLDLRPLN
jgi:DNA polymerase family A